VNQIARQAGVPAHTVRYYTRIGLLRPAKRRDNGYKEFTTREVDRLKFIRRAQRLGFTLSEIEEITRRAARHESPCPAVREIVRRRLEENRALLGEVSALVARMERALATWADMKDGVPDGNAVCALIESLKEV
jgi:MerR family Zn(II)-responsive transcriptional regulator of zntA